MIPPGTANTSLTKCDAIVNLPEDESEGRLVDLLYAFGPCFFSPWKLCGNCNAPVRFKLCVDGDQLVSYSKCECSEAMHSPEEISSFICQAIKSVITYEILPIYFCSLRSAKDDDVVLAIWVPGRNYRSHYAGKLSTPRVLTNLVNTAYADLCGAAFMGSVTTYYAFVGDLQTCEYLYFCLQNKRDVVCIALTSRNVEFTRVYYIAREALMGVR